MKYNILNLADVHYGVMDPGLQYENLELFLIFLQKYKNIDLIVILGDYFHSQLPLNSQSAINAIQWMNRLYVIAKQIGVKKVRVIKGTKEHDNDQLESFRELEDESGFFKIFNANTYEETLPDLKCIYCPDESINAKDYKLKYIDNLLKFPNIGFFHGSFDVVLPDIVVQLSEETSMKSIIYEYNFWSKIIQGPMISGHWHDGNELDSLIYIGSYDRWAFDEMQNKGFGFVQIDTTTNEYFYKKIKNEFALDYITYTINTHLYNTIQDYTAFIKNIDHTIDKEKNQKIRIVINITDEKDINDTFIMSIKHYFINNKTIKVVTKNKIKNNKKDEKKKKNVEVKSKYSFIFDKSLDKAEVIQRFILESKNKEIPIDKIQKVIDKYIK